MKTILEVRASNMARIMACAGSLHLDGLPPQEDIEAAKEGTACGEYLERTLLGMEIGTHARNGVAFDDEMKYTVKHITEKILNPYKGLECESEVNWMSRSGIKVGAHSDVSYENAEGELCIDDLKYGWVIIDVKKNWQLLTYAIGEVMKRQKAYPFINLRILQPRPHHEDGPFRLWRISWEELLEYKEQIEARLDQIAGGFAELSTSSKCKYCPGAVHSVCPAFNRALFHGVDYVLGEFRQDTINETQIAYQLQIMDRVNEIFKIKNDSLKQLAVDRIKNGGIIPGYGIEKSFGDRKWKSSITPEAIEMMTGVNVIKTEMLSPAQSEKVGVPKDLVAQLTDRHFIGMKLQRRDAAVIGAKIFGGG